MIMGITLVDASIHLFIHSVVEYIALLTQNTDERTGFFLFLLYSIWGKNRELNKMYIHYLSFIIAIFAAC